MNGSARPSSCTAGPNADGVEWVLNLNPIPMIRGSASQIRSLLAYLIQNAREAMPRGAGTITFSTSVDPRTGSSWRSATPGAA